MCIEAIVWNILQLRESWRCRKGPKRSLLVGRFGSRQKFSVTTELFGSVSQHGSLCCDMVLRLQVVAGSRRGFS